jgi:hypothetical protein
MFPALAVMQDAGFQVAGEQFHAQRVEGAAGGGDLVEDIEAITVFVDHLADAADLAANAVDAGAYFFSFFGVHGFLEARRLRAFRASRQSLAAEMSAEVASDANNGNA